MLPSAQKYLSKGGLSPTAAAYATIGCFLGGVVGIQFLSRFLHHYIPSHVVDCDHSHDEDDEDEDDKESHDDHHHNGHAHKLNGHASEETPLLSHDDIDLKSGSEPRSTSVNTGSTQRFDNSHLRAPTLKTRPTLQSRLTSRMTTLVSGGKTSCGEGGPCFGYSEPCGQECFKAISRSPTRLSTRPPTRAPTRAFGRFSVSGPPRQPSLLRTVTAPYSSIKAGLPKVSDEEIAQLSPRPLHQRPALPASQESAKSIFRGREGNGGGSPSHLGKGVNATSTDYEQDEDENPESPERRSSMASATDTANDPSHHHHVPTNAFLAIGLQTSIAIALHKLPEGFITYATNHANPMLGFTVFMALFIHNITEGFAMALPLYLAINSRWKAMFWSSLLGGVSQPLGAGVAALWFKIAGRGDAAPGDTVYGCMFAITAGIMASVALQLFSESLSLTHNRNLCTAFAFIGMGILGMSFALTAG